VGYIVNGSTFQILNCTAAENISHIQHGTVPWIGQFVGTVLNSNLIINNSYSMPYQKFAWNSTAGLWGSNSFTTFTIYNNTVTLLQNESHQ